MTELVVISGKGGTGKTSLTACFAVLAQQAVVADADVDAADLHLLLTPSNGDRHEFVGGHEAIIRPDDCLRCGACLSWCRFDAVRRDQQTGALWIEPLDCEGCGLCVRLCPAEAIDFTERQAGWWSVSTTRCGPMVHARLNPGGENSGKLVTIVRQEARRLAEEQGRELILVDGPPGIGCPVIASVTGASAVLAVTEPTPAGEHDVERVLSLCQHFGVPAAVCVNKWDLNPALAERIERRAAQRGARPVGRIPYDPRVAQAQVEARSVVEAGGPAAEAVRAVWAALDLGPRHP